jgi:outer membrane protein assembly factor BamB
MDGSDQQYVIALDKATGVTRWKTDRSTEFNDIDARTGKPVADGDYRKGFSTPIVIEVDGQAQLISPGAKAAFAYDPRSGEEIWTVRYGNHSSASRTLYGHGMLFINTGFSVPELLAIDPTGRGDVTETHVVWRVARGVPNKPAPLLIGDHIYMLNDGGIATCVAARTGEQVWRGRVGGEYSAALIHAEGRIYGFSQEGKAVILRVGAEFDLVGENHLDAGFMASPAIFGRALILRTETHLYRIENQR